jgi:hypothetical protein
LLGGVVIEFGFCMMSRKVWNCGETSRSGLSSADVMVGAFLSPLLSLTTASVSVVRYFSSAQASSGFFEFLAMPPMLPVMYPPPYRSE